MLNTKDQLVLLRSKIDRGAVDEDYRKTAYKEKSELNKSLAGTSKAFKKQKKRNENKRRKVADEDDDDY